MSSQKAWLKPVCAVAVIVLFATGCYFFFFKDDPKQPAATTPVSTGTRPTPAASSARAPQPVSCPNVARLFTGKYDPTVEYATDSPYMRDRVFDYVEATLNPDMHKQLSALRTRGVPSGLLTDSTDEEYADEVKNTPSAPPGSDITYVLDRKASTYDPQEDEDARIRTVNVTAIYYRCRGGKLIGDDNRPVIDTGQASNPLPGDDQSLTWIKEKGAWRVISE